MHHVTYAVRELSKHRGNFGFAVIVLAIGIGGAIASFAMADSILARPLPTTHPNETMSVRLASRARAQRVGVSAGTVSIFERTPQVVEAAATFVPTAVNIGVRSGAVRVNSAVVSASFFKIFDAEPLLGRTFVPGDIGGVPSVVISERVWRGTLGSDLDVVGSLLVVDEVPTRVIGVLPRSFSFSSSDSSIGLSEDLWLLSTVSTTELRDIGAGPYEGILLLTRGLSLVNAQHRLNEAFAAEASEVTEHGYTVFLAPLRNVLISDTERNSLWLLAIGGGIILLIASVNASNIMMAFAVSRQDHLVLQRALGATEGQLFIVALLKATIITAAAGIPGIVIAAVLLWTVPALMPSYANVSVLGVDRWFILLVGTTAVIGVLSSALPLMLCVARSRQSGGRIEHGTAVAGRRHLKMAQALIACQIALTEALLVEGALFGVTVSKLRAVNTGVKLQGMVIGSLTPFVKYPSDVNRAAFYTDVLRACRAVDGFEDVTVASFGPVAQASSPVVPVRAVGPQSVIESRVAWRAVSDRYFESLQIQLLQGRTLLTSDRAGGRNVAVVNQMYARELSGAGNPIGQVLNINIGRSRVINVEIVGVVSDVRRTLRDVARSEIYLPILQHPSPRASILARVRRQSIASAAALQMCVARVDPGQPVSDIRSAEGIIDDQIQDVRVRTILWSVLGVLAVIITTAGIYGGVRQSVQERLREIAVKMALGAPRLILGRSVFRFAMTPVLIGLLMGVGVSLSLSKVTAHLLFGTTITSPSAFVSIAIAICVIAIAASVGPLRRALSVDPVITLREN